MEQPKNLSVTVDNAGGRNVRTVNYVLDKNYHYSLDNNNLPLEYLLQ